MDLFVSIVLQETSFVWMGLGASTEPLLERKSTFDTIFAGAILANLMTSIRTQTASVQDQIGVEFWSTTNSGSR